ncbi:MAG: hypothetical protein J0I49_34765 [Pseudonocardia sp.]|mgnify:CR=1 FL=1|uniref:hypothetical protein n=1 Tax=Pseudonocardia sp. TaxID=60912 RepID=UPI001ACC66C9|nr:hypothetical protein [Pseudonocardia sp.]MBN9103221.1 hypothetical protein [Pseudonocardia sp.]
MLAITDRGAVASGEHVGTLGGELLEREGRPLEVAGPLADELHANLAAGGGGLRDVDQGGRACLPTLRDAVVLRGVRERAVVEQLEGGPGTAVPCPGRPGRRLLIIDHPSVVLRSRSVGAPYYP